MGPLLPSLIVSCDWYPTPSQSPLPGKVTWSVSSALYMVQEFQEFLSLNMLEVIVRNDTIIFPIA